MVSTVEKRELQDFPYLLDGFLSSFQVRQMAIYQTVETVEYDLIGYFLRPLLETMG